MRRCLGVVVLALLIAIPVFAQETSRRGLWGGFGLGAGSIGCEDCIDRTSGFSGLGMIGGTLSDVVRIGGGGTFFTRDDNGATLQLTSGLFIIQIFPGRGDFFIQGGGGFGRVEIDVGIAKLEDEGAAFLIGLGYTFNLGQSEGLAIVPFANWLPTSISFNPDLFQIGVGLIWN